MSIRLLPLSPVPSVISVSLSRETNFNGKEPGISSAVSQMPQRPAPLKYFNEKYVPVEIWTAH